MIDKIDWLGHASFRIRGSKILYIDPWKTTAEKDADIILVTHDHFDHLAPEDIDRLKKNDTVIIGPAEVTTKVKSGSRTIKAGETITVKGVAVTAVPAYNTNKKFHPRTTGKVGYLILVDGTTIYHAGDTDHIPEMSSINCDICLLPVSGTYVMTAEEAAQALGDIKAKIAIPMHYGDIVGDESDARRFKELAKIEVVIKKPVK